MARQPFGKLWAGAATEAITRMDGGDGFAEFTLSEANVLAMTSGW